MVGKKGVSSGTIIIVGAFITFLVLLIVSMAFQSSGGNLYNPLDPVGFYKNLFSEKNLKDPFVLVISFFVPFIATFAVSWAFIGILPVFRDTYKYRTADRAAAVLSLGIALYTMPSINYFITVFFPYSLIIAFIFLGIGLIGKSIQWGIIPFIDTYAGMKEAMPPKGPDTESRDEEGHIERETRRRQPDVFRGQTVEDLQRQWGEIQQLKSKLKENVDITVRKFEEINELCRL